MPTTTLSGTLDITGAVNPPRTAFLNYPLGHASGKAFDLDDQTSVVRAALQLLETAESAPTLVELPNSWEDVDPGWEDRAYRRGGSEHGD